MSEEKKQEQEKKQEPGQIFELQRIHLVDASFESPQAPAIFTKEQKFNSNVELNSSNRKLGDNVYEVMLDLSLTVKSEDEKVAYLVEIKYAGIFTATGFGNEQLGHLLGSYCPNLIYPFAREVVSDLVVKGGFPQMLLAPINFDALYTQHLEQQKKAQGEVEDATKH